MDTKVYKNNLGHFEVLIYDRHHYEHYEMIKPTDMNWLNCLLQEGMAKRLPIIDWQELSMEEFMQQDNLDLRTAIKQRQEAFYPF